jgi:hypothetical protein
MRPEHPLGLVGRTLADDLAALGREIPPHECDYATHNLHPYPGKFIPHVPAALLRHLARPGDLVLDPMCGAGTTLVEGLLAGVRVLGVDLDPTGTLVASVASTPIPAAELREPMDALLAEVGRRIARGDDGRVAIPGRGEFPNVLLWFREATFRRLAVIRAAIADTLSLRGHRDAALCALSAIVRPVSNADPRDIFPERDPRLPVRPEVDPVERFRLELDRVVRKVGELHELLAARRDAGRPEARVALGDARHLPIADGAVDAIITSPPYAYAVDYARVHQLSTLLVAMGNERFIEHRRGYLGTDRVSRYARLGSFEGIEFARAAVEALHASRQRWGIALYRYLVDMRNVTLECARVLRPGGALAYVVGASTLRRTPFRTDDVLERFCVDAGLRVESRFERPYRRYRMTPNRNTHSGRIGSDVFLVCRK